MNRLLIGLTGLIGSGKTLVSSMFARHGAYIIDTDVIARELTAINGDALILLRQYFGDDYFNLDGSLNRLRLKQLVFNDINKKYQLENILHPMIYDKVLEQLTQIESGIVIIVVPLLFKSPKYLELVQRSLFIDVEQSELINRVLSRDNINIKMVRQILSQQLPRLEQLKLSDDIIDNNGNINDLELKVTKYYNLYGKILENQNDKKAD
jgi:dephospho-CoA kinase